MKRLVLLGASLLLAAGGPAAGIARVVHIDFDTAPNGDPIANGTVVNTLYATACGVTFDAVRCPQCGTDPNVYASSNCLVPGTLSPPNVVTLYGGTSCSDICELNLGLVRATFASPADSVCIRVKPVRSFDRGVLHVYDAGGSEIATVYSAYGATEDLCVAVPGIARVSFSGPFVSYAWFDDLTVRMDAATPVLHPTWGGLKSIYR